MVYAILEKEPVKNKKIRVSDIIQAKNNKILSCTTCYDATFAKILNKSDIDLVLVGDSLGNVIKGAKTTLQVTIDDIVYHTKNVSSVLDKALLVADMPFATMGFDDKTAYENVEKVMKAGAEAVKVEGASPSILNQIAHLTSNGIPVIGHIGLMPQSVHALSGYKKQGKFENDKQRLLLEAQNLQQAGCFAIVLELVEADIAQQITQSLKIPTIGIGAGATCDGQILVIYDMLGLNNDFKPNFLKHFVKLELEILKALTNYVEEVKNKTFPEN